MKLIPESYKQHVNRIHIIVVAIAALFLLICVTWMLILVIVGHDAFPKEVRLFFGRLLFITLPTSIIAIALVIYSFSRRFHKVQSETHHKKRLESSSADRAELLKNFEHVKYYYPFRPLQTFIPLLIIPAFLTAVALYYSAFFPFGMIAIFIMFMVVPVWLSYRVTKNDCVHLTAEGLSYHSLSQTYLIPWNTIKEIRLTKKGYLIQGTDHHLTIGLEIEPTSIPKRSFIDVFLSNNRYAKKLIEQIQQLAPHAYYRKSFLERDIFAKD